jgi:hypothetical protein
MSIVALKTYDAQGNLVFDSQQYYYFRNAEFLISPAWRAYPIGGTANNSAQAFPRSFPAPIPLTANPFAIISRSPAISNLANALAAINGARNLCYWDFVKSADGLNYTGMTIYAEAENPTYYSPNNWIIQVWAIGIYD